MKNFFSHAYPNFGSLYDRTRSFAQAASIFESRVCGTAVLANMHTSTYVFLRATNPLPHIILSPRMRSPLFSSFSAEHLLVPPEVLLRLPPPPPGHLVAALGRGEEGGGGGLGRRRLGGRGGRGGRGGGLHGRRVLLLLLGGALGHGGICFWEDIL